MRTLLSLTVIAFLGSLSLDAAADEGFLSSSMYCKDAYLELKSKGALQDEVDSMARSCQAQHEKNLLRNDWEKQESAERLRVSKLPAPAIGMTANSVIKGTRWGAPLSVNRTTTATGISEQWVYGGGSYLYFKHGRLYAIQD